MAENPKDIRRENNLRDRFNRKYGRLHLFYLFALVRRAPGVAFVGVLKLLFMIGLAIAIYPLFIMLPKDLGALMMFIVIILGIIGYVVSDFLAGWLWREIGESTRNVIRGVISFSARRVQFSLLVLFATAVVASVLNSVGLLEPQKSIVQTASSAQPVAATERLPQAVNPRDLPLEPAELPVDWLIPMANKQPLELDFTMAQVQCAAFGRLPTAAEIASVRDDLRRLNGEFTFWSGERDGNKSRIFAFGSGSSSSGWFDHSLQRAANKRLNVLCVRRTNNQ